MWRSSRCTSTALAVVACLLAEGGAEAAPADRETGRRIYEEGVLPSGEPLTARLPGEVVLSARDAACAGCHRPSGFGGSEGRIYVPPITGPALAAPRRPATVSRGELLEPLYRRLHTAASRARVRTLAPRPAYDAAALAVALREGVDPAGRLLDRAMPRYRLSDADLAALGRYLGDLGATPDPGVEPDTVHLATVVTPGADPAAREALLAVVDAYVRHRNADVRGFLAHPGHSPWHRDEVAGSLRAWRVHLWEPTGPPEGWTAQLRNLYRRRPVFAVVGGLSGLGAGEPWQPIHAFCEAEAVPCLFPFTDLPGTDPPPRWSVYLSAGLAGEARALGEHLARWAEEAEGCAGGVRVVQAFPDRGAGRVASGALAEALAGAPAVRLEDRPLGGAEAVAALPGAVSGPCTAWVLWLREAELARLGPRAKRRLAAAARVYLSSRLAGTAVDALAAELGDRLRLTWPFALPLGPAPREYRVRAWMRSRGVDLTAEHERLQLATHLALAVADHALRHLVTRFSRAYFLERVEHEAERSLDPGLFPHLALGPGQRIASEGCYVLRPDPAAPGGFGADGGWIVP